ncbi:HSP90 family protein [Leucobacter allii]|uniref:HSP90 family protein n=1 Tax=Leucobacter allii TaxID=2932247 RepID=A0ABY4FQI4_9MICO|nr:HSP90 family protein [Leucobacter allii]UOQ58521.1 HSP90 family protein [Leucobacter allii]
MSERFQVELSGMVDLLSRHLYSGPQVYLRELIQNAVDAVTARCETDPGAAARVRLSVEEAPGAPPVLRIADTGIGLTAAEATELLATIGRSSKRDAALGTGREAFIGQFGIGMLASFMVADRIVVRSRSCVPGAAAIRWAGSADGTFEVSELPEDDPEAGRVEVGTTVELVARPDAAHWFATETVLGLAREYASLLPVDIAVRVPDDRTTRGGGTTDPARWRRVTEPDLPWRADFASPAERERALAAYCEEVLGFTPLASIDLSLPLAGVSGVAFVLPQAVAPGSGQHRVYMKRMLLGSRVDGVLPEWAFFARAILDSEALSPTASREQVHDDEVLLGVREALGEQLKTWAMRELRAPTALARRVLETHHLALRALAVTDPEMLELVAEVLPFETSDGAMTLREAGSGDDDGAGEIVYTATTEAYRRVAAVARAQGMVVVNAGYVYDAELMERLGRRPGWRVRELASADLAHVLATPSLAREDELRSAVARARALLTAEDCDAVVRDFAPESVPAILLRDPEGEHRRALERERAAAPELWADLLGAFAEPEPARSRSLVLNDRSALVRRLLAAPAGPVFDAGLRAVYLSALMLAGEGLRATESNALSEALGVLLGSALAAPDPRGGAERRSGGVPTTDDTPDPLEEGRP